MAVASATESPASDMTDVLSTAQLLVLAFLASALPAVTAGRRTGKLCTNAGPAIYPWATRQPAAPDAGAIEDRNEVSLCPSGRTQPTRRNIRL